jgi:hypothetical protein
MQLRPLVRLPESRWKRVGEILIKQGPAHAFACGRTVARRGGHGANVALSGMA